MNGDIFIRREGGSFLQVHDQSLSASCYRNMYFPWRVAKLEEFLEVSKEYWTTQNMAVGWISYKWHVIKIG